VGGGAAINQAELETTQAAEVTTAEATSAPDATADTNPPGGKTTTPPGNPSTAEATSDPAETLSGYRQDLQAGKDRTVAYADYSIEGDQGRVASVSGQAPRPGAVDAPSNHLFGTTATGNNSRMYDAEDKILEHIGNMYADNPSVTGTVDLYVDRDPCDSCRGVFDQFGQSFPNILLKWTWIHKPS